LFYKKINNQTHYEASGKVISFLKKKDSVIGYMMSGCGCADDGQLYAEVPGSDEINVDCHSDHEKDGDDDGEDDSDSEGEKESKRAKKRECLEPSIKKGMPADECEDCGCAGLCDAGWSYHNGNCYKALLDGKVGYGYNKSACDGYKAKVVTIKSKTELSYVNKMISKSMTAFRIKCACSYKVYFWSALKLTRNSKFEIINAKWDGEVDNAVYGKPPNGTGTAGTCPWAVNNNNTVPSQDNGNCVFLTDFGTGTFKSALCALSALQVNGSPNDYAYGTHVCKKKINLLK